MLKHQLMFFAVLCFLFGCKQHNQKDTKTEVIKSKVSFVESVEQRDRQAPNFSWKDSNGKVVNFDEIHKKVTLINFWATWCSPCRKEIPDLIEINKEFVDRGIRIIGISVDKGARVLEDVGDFVEENKIDYPIIIDDGKLSEAFGNVRGLPTTFLIDENKNIIKKFVGIKSKEFFISQIEKLIN